MRIHDALLLNSIPRIDAELLLAHVLSKDRTWILAHENDVLEREAERAFKERAKRRENHEPLAYILGQKEFYGRRLIVTPDVLIPRPSTEVLIESALTFLKSPSDGVNEADSEIVVAVKKLREIRPEIIVDIGTGSGCIAITLALEGVQQEIIGVDTSAKALAVAKKNARELGAKVSFVESDGVRYIRKFEKPFLLVSNPPYIPEKTKLPRDVSDFEPALALFAGKDGTDVLVPLAKACRENPFCSGFVIECRSDQVSAMLSL